MHGRGHCGVETGIFNRIHEKVSIRQQVMIRDGKVNYSGSIEKGMLFRQENCSPYKNGDI